MTRVAALVFLAVAGAAHADPDDPGRAPGFVTLDRMDAVTRGGAVVAYVWAPDASGAIGRMVEPYGQVVDPEYRIGGYFQMRLDKLYGSPLAGPETSEPDVGALWLPELGLDHVALVVRGGLGLPFSSRGSGAEVGGIARPVDTILDHLRDHWIVRLSTSPLVRKGPVFARVDLGFDAEAGMGSWQLSRRIAVGGGYDLKYVAPTAEIVYVHTSNGRPDDVAMATIAVRGMIGFANAYAALSWPLNDGASQAVTVVASFGLEATL